MTVAEVACWAEAGAALTKRATRPARVVVNFIVMFGVQGLVLLGLNCCLDSFGVSVECCAG